MKKFTAIALVALLLVGILAGCGGSKGTQTVEKGKLIMATNAAFPPYESTDDNGNFIGIDIEVAQAIAGKLGLELVIDNMEFTAALEAAQKGKPPESSSVVTHLFWYQVRNLVTKSMLVWLLKRKLSPSAEV